MFEQCLQIADEAKGDVEVVADGKGGLMPQTRVVGSFDCGDRISWLARRADLEHHVNVKLLPPHGSDAS